MGPRPDRAGVQERIRHQANEGQHAQLSGYPEQRRQEPREESDDRYPEREHFEVSFDRSDRGDRFVRQPSDRAG